MPRPCGRFETTLRRQLAALALACAVGPLSPATHAATPNAGQRPDEDALVSWRTLPATDLVPSGTAWVLSKAPDGEVVRAHDNVRNATELLMRIVPDTALPGENPTTLYLSALFRGRELKTTPDRVWLRAQSNLSVQSTRLRTPTLSLTAGGLVVLDVIDPDARVGAAGWLNYPCNPADSPCSYDGVVAAIPIVRFFRMLEADTAHGEALGVPFLISRSRMRALAAFARELVPGADWRVPRPE